MERSEAICPPVLFHPTRTACSTYQQMAVQEEQTVVLNQTCISQSSLTRHVPKSLQMLRCSILALLQAECVQSPESSGLWDKVGAVECADVLVWDFIVATVRQMSRLGRLRQLASAKVQAAQLSSAVPKSGLLNIWSGKLGRVPVSYMVLIRKGAQSQTRVMGAD